MSVTNILSLLGGLALFLYGMQMMNSGLESVAGNRMKQILERLTANRFLGVMVGMGITAVIQSSSATTVMVVGFVNSGMMTLRQAVWIIMGANIGTTVTGLLIGLDIGVLAPTVAFIGVAVVVFVKNQKLQQVGQILAGFGILFIGMDMMSGAMEPLREMDSFVSLMTRFSNPILGILAGAVFTAIIQSSSASVGILQSLAASGVIGLGGAVYVLFGQNIGTCITAAIASIGTSRAAKRTTIIHLSFNVIGTVVFTLICYFLPLTGLIESLIPDQPKMQIAAMHTLFNVSTTLILLPFGMTLASFATKILPDHPSEQEEGHRLAYIKEVETSEYHMGMSAIILNGVRKELGRMADMARQNVERSFDAVLALDPAKLAEVEKTEDYIDFLNKGISQYISRIIVYETNERDSAELSSFFKIASNIERIGDHAINICGYTRILEEKRASFSEKAREEIVQMREVSLLAMDRLKNISGLSVEGLTQISAFEQKIDDMTAQFRRNQMDRMRDGSCSDEACIIYSEMLTDFERIGDHILNIGEELARSGIQG